MMTVAGLGLAAPIVQPPEPETLVEGHTVFTVIEQVNVNAQDEVKYAAAVAVLVREINYDFRSFRFPGVVWFNDQYLVNPKSSPGSNAPTYRHPCNGAVIVVPRGDPNPTLDPATTFAQSNYVESYKIRDPNNKDWIVDKWMVNGRPVWSVAIMNDGTKYHLADDGTGNCSPQNDSPCGGPVLLPWDDPDNPSAFNDTGPQGTPFSGDRRSSACAVRAVAGSRATPGGYSYPCGGVDTTPTSTCVGLQYNAVLFFFLDDLPVAGTLKDHRTGSTDRARDASGCHADVDTTVPLAYNAWPCPGGNDDREGNSHAYNPDQPYPLMTYSGRNNHGGSADCTGDAVGDQECHATRLVDVYYGHAALPTRTPSSFVFTDAEGSSAPYHCHKAPATNDPRTWCNQNDAFAAAGQQSP